MINLLDLTYYINHNVLFLDFVFKFNEAAAAGVLEIQVGELDFLLNLRLVLC